MVVALAVVVEVSQTLHLSLLQIDYGVELVYPLVRRVVTFLLLPVHSSVSVFLRSGDGGARSLTALAQVRVG